MSHPKITKVYVLTVAAAFSLNACCTQDNKTVSQASLSVTTIFSAINCNISNQGITNVADHATVQAIINKANSHRLNTTPISVPSINFESNTVYLVALGNKPNSGYALKSTGMNASYEQGILSLPIEVQRPSEQGMYAQVMTSPCTLVTLPSGAYKLVNVKNWEQ